MKSHMMDMCFTVVTESNADDVTAEQLLAGMLSRVAYLSRHPEEIIGACGFSDTIEANGQEVPPEYALMKVRTLVGAQQAYACIELAGRSSDFALMPGRSASNSLRESAKENREKALRLLNTADLMEAAAITLSDKDVKLPKLPHEMTFDKFAKGARLVRLFNHGRKWEVFFGDNSLGFCDPEGEQDALRQAHAREVNNALFANSSDNTGIVPRTPMPPAEVLAEYPEICARFEGILITA